MRQSCSRYSGHNSCVSAPASRAKFFFSTSWRRPRPTCPCRASLATVAKRTHWNTTSRRGCRGVAYADANLRPDAQHDVIFNVGRLLRRLHAIPQQPFHDSAHFPTDRTAAEFKRRLFEYFDVVARRLEAKGRTWPLEIPFETVRGRTLAALPQSQEFVALHSNPGPPHTFVDRATGRLQGLIDFGDAYISHPALDLWRWRWPAERAAALAGYTADAPVSDDFMRTWKAVAVVASAILIAFFPDRQDEATRDLRQSLSDL